MYGALSKETHKTFIPGDRSFREFSYAHKAPVRVYNTGVKLVAVKGPLQVNLISSGPDQCNHCITALVISVDNFQLFSQL